MNDQTGNSPGDTMMAVVTTGNGGYDKLDYRPVPVPAPGPGEVLLRVLAAGVNNTEINTRLGWYSSSVTTDTSATAVSQAEEAEHKADGGWNEATPFPLIQGTDCCGRVVGAGDGVEPALTGKRVLVRACMRPNGYDVMDNIWMASDFDGAFAEYVKVPASEVFAVDCDWSDEELATIPCAYGTSENMLHRAGVGAGDLVLVTGASGGVGSATVQLAKRRGARVAAVTGKAKMEQVRALGADVIIERGQDPVEILGENCVDVVVDNVAGPGFPVMLKVLKRGGRYVSSGAIAGPIVELDMRDMYLKDITLIGCTAWDAPVFPDLVGYIERGEIRPLLAKVFALKDIARAQAEFLEKTHFGNFVLVPPQEQD
ncbi:alcohol dehydrogenase family protein [Alisedimentitalea sp. MJ-SS2]|uniref:alcohol dehydrogenase family protein n=1 Tax=Aliisedimentitalea sp. MJ-SS2 TaxID=3049795 RepID=UPI0029133A6D|nr:alcohol dehydrogenase family protein [Alisedimentitalea sp. MJ-SS2]MDU8928460.1 alcohol dehydrogenase family protein [Alisedimentitalea sp. MJ-SS2]